ncbi:O-antigen translocase [Polynucleobacter sp. AP-Nickl1-40-C4]|uniref:O-antigen translocase n=1 Tax=Polynucleobacter sp. AP-Nickl1-40-C4 TaxID=3108275 RepID=UPI002B22E17C|nr:O-antigen translocase [Polynucleobacter sp. AP-Nickl1-40-C4]MEA9568021.1 O-antigen translocase [Polynucleobacter sp. AP-Nickl1-40-C4]
MAVYVGPSGYAVIGQLQNVIGIISNLSGGLLLSGITKMTAQHFDEIEKQKVVWITAVRYSSSVAILFAVLILLFGSKLSAWLFRGLEIGNIYVWLALALPAIVLNNLLLAVINGKKEIGVYVVANILGSMLSLMVAAVLVTYYGLYGALVACIINPAIALLSTLLLIRGRTWFKFSSFVGSVNTITIKELAGFGFMGLVSALTGPIASIVVRDHLIDSFGIVDAGYWQATTKISDNYLMLIVSTLSVYYLPRISEIRKANELRAEIIKVYSLVMPIAIIGALVIYLLRDSIIHILFASDFIAMEMLMPWQLIGDVIKIGAWVLSFALAGRAMIKPFVITEVCFSATYVLLTIMLTKFFGITGVVMAYAGNYLAYLICMGYFINKELARMKKMEPL